MITENLFALATQLYGKYKLSQEEMATMNKVLFDVCCLEQGADVATKMFMEPVEEKEIN